MHEIIKRHYVLVNDKMGFCERLGAVLGITGSAVANRYFGTYLRIPKDNMDITLRELKKELRKQSRQIELTLRLDKEKP
tara:strand:+ start:8071 stop:8307 length:237 start_codon:yes stop_codon:yes gene_type:complete